VSREQQVLEKVREKVDEGGKPSAGAVSQELDWSEEDVHRCLNILEKKGEIETYTREVLGKKMRMVSVYR
jgi:Mn-dependent DtxR family transcriptional regulator